MKRLSVFLLFVACVASRAVAFGFAPSTALRPPHVLGSVGALLPEGQTAGMASHFRYDAFGGFRTSAHPGSDCSSQPNRVPYRNPNPKGRSWVDFDDYDADTQTLVDVKKSVRTTEKGLDQAGRQLKAAHQAGVENVVWRVPNQAEKLRAMAFFKRKGITGIDVEVSP